MKGSLWSLGQQRVQPSVFGRDSAFFFPSHSSISSSFLYDFTLSLHLYPFPSLYLSLPDATLQQGLHASLLGCWYNQGNGIKNQWASLSKAPRMVHFDVSSHIWNSYVVTLHFILLCFFFLSFLHCDCSHVLFKDMDWRHCEKGPHLYFSLILNICTWLGGRVKIINHLICLWLEMAWWGCWVLERQRHWERSERKADWKSFSHVQKSVKSEGKVTDAHVPSICKYSLVKKKVNKV